MNELFGLPYFVWFLVCLTIAVVYIIFYPKQANSANVSKVERLILKYAHSTVWLLLALACILANYKIDEAASVVPFISLIVYIVFVVTLIKLQFKNKR